MRDDVNIRSPRFLLARTIGICRHCLSPTPLVGLALPPGHMVLELDHEAHDDAEAIDAWRIASGSAFIFEVEFIPAAVQSRIQQITRLFRRSAAAAADACWTNHCERCAGSLDDRDLFCEPEGAFLPTNDANASLIQLVSVDECFEAVRGGYAYEPAYFGATR